MGVRQALFPVLAFGATFLRLPASRRYGITESGVFGLVEGLGSIPIPEAMGFE